MQRANGSPFRIAIYLLGGALFSLTIAGAYFAEVSLGLPFFQTPIQIIGKGLVSVGCLSVLRKSHPTNLFSVSFRPSYLLWGLLPILLSGVSHFTIPADPYPFLDNVWYFFGILSTIVAEELYYRALGVYLLQSKDGKISSGRIAILVAGFALSHMVNAVSDPYGALLTTLLAVGIGCMLLGIYLKTSSLFLPILLHLLLNCLSSFFVFNSGGIPALVSGIWFWMLFAAQFLSSLFIGLFLLSDFF